MTRKRWIQSLGLLLGLALAACSPGAMPTSRPPQTQVASEPLAVVAATQAPLATLVPGSPGQLAYLPVARQMVIKDANLELEVADVSEAVARITQLAGDYGGYILSSRTWEDEDVTFASLKLALPSSEFETALNHLRRMGLKVIQENTSGQDVSAEYTDVASQLENLEATAARVRTFLDSAKTVTESLQINAELSRLEGQIETIKGQMRYYEGRSAFSTVSITLTPQAVPAEPKPEPEPAWSPAKTVTEAFKVLRSIGQVATDAAIWLLVVVAPIAIMGGLVLWAAAWVGRRFAAR